MNEPKQPSTVTLPVDPCAIVRADMPPGAICFHINTAGEPMLKITQDGFWVRGQKVEQGDGEARAVYDAFLAWLRASGQRA